MDFSTLPKMIEELLEKKHRKTNQPLYLLINKVNCTSIEAIFTDLMYAQKYMIRIAVNFFFMDFVPEDHPSLKGEDLLKEIVRDILPYYEIINVYHLNQESPIYQSQSGNYCVHGPPEEYLTNSLDTWKTKNANYHSEIKDWQQQCTIVVDPVLPDLEEITPDTDENSEK